MEATKEKKKKKKTKQRTALEIPIAGKHLQIARTLVHTGAKINERLQQIFDDAVKAGNEAVMSVLRLAGADTNGHSSYRKSLILSAMERGNDTTIKFLLGETDVDLNRRSKEIWGETLIIRTTVSNNEAMLNLLLKRKADVNIPDWRGRIALIWAIQKGYSNLVQQLIEDGADVNVTDKERKTPTEIQVQRRNCFWPVQI